MLTNLNSLTPNQTDKQKTFSLVFAVLANSTSPFDSESFNLIKEIGLKGMAETWSETRKSVGRAMADLASKAFTRVRERGVHGLLCMIRADNSMCDTPRPTHR